MIKGQAKAPRTYRPWGFGTGLKPDFLSNHHISYTFWTSSPLICRASFNKSNLGQISSPILSENSSTVIEVKSRWQIPQNWGKGMFKTCDNATEEEPP